ncbi:9046_t:CDS:1 [Acaulospora morrowiae]|uniref:9046_t:CDS:1 n=1 Tax=Acaulospora morrowiae TaxID=94023 RepID=A0A9N9G073_9GLOM|nr:9046_t:CDS:1 [Acaulospora morrowiae]
MERRDIPRRRPMLQLDQPISSIRVKNRAADEAKKCQESKNALQELLGEYSESENEEDVEDSQTESSPAEKAETVFSSSSLDLPIPPPTRSLPTSEQSIAIDQSEDSIEVALKNFMSEINALPVTSISNDTSMMNDESGTDLRRPKAKKDDDQSSSQSSLPDGEWQQYWSQDNNRYYYYNGRTGETRWEIDVPKGVSDPVLVTTTTTYTAILKEGDNLKTASGDSLDPTSNVTSAQQDFNREAENQSSSSTGRRNEFSIIASLIAPPSDSPLHFRSRDVYGRLSGLIPLATHMKLERHQIEFATRLYDWQVGALNTQYFEKTILERLEALLVSLEEQISPAGWSCKWNSDGQQHSWIHLKTNQISFTYPSPDLTTSLGTLPVNTALAHQTSYPPLPPLPPPPPLPQRVGDTDGLEVRPDSSDDDGSGSVTGSQTSSWQGSVSVNEKKRKKDKEVASSGFKNKKMATLVEKWKAAEDFLANTDWEEVRRQQNGIHSKDPETWIKEQIESGEASNNPNFEPIKGDWRQRIRNRKPEKGE